ncbi:MAG: hydroxyethylthiazole kinase [Propionibacteriaceae bacterium]
MSNKSFSSEVAVAVEQLRNTQPLVQCLTNIVVANFTANVLLAAGAAPAMVDNEVEAGTFAAIASGTLINSGTPYLETSMAMQQAAEQANNLVIDPVAYGLPWRSQIIDQVLAKGQPAIIRGNASEIMALAGAQSAGRGVDAGDESIAALQSAKELAVQHKCVVAVSGAVDYLTDGRRIVMVASGHELMTKVTGVGCSLGALMAAYAGVCEDKLVAATAATAHLCVAAQRSAAITAGPGSFAVTLLDQLAAVSAADVVNEGRITGEFFAL